MRIHSILLTLLGIAALAGVGFMQPTCPDVLVERDGKVYPGGPARANFTCTTTSLTVSVQRVTGNAGGRVRIYVNNSLVKTLTFPNSGGRIRRSHTLANTVGKSIRIELTAQSALGFPYRMRAMGESSLLGLQTANLSGGTQKSVSFDSPCTDRAKITVKRTGGRARARVTIYQGNQIVHQDILERNDTQYSRTLSGAMGKRYRCVVKNLSVGNFVKVTISGREI